MGTIAWHALKGTIEAEKAHRERDFCHPRRRSRSWRASILEHRQRLRDDLRTSPSLGGHAQAVLEDAYADARARAITETGLADRTLPPAPPYTLQQTLDPDFPPD